MLAGRYVFVQFRWVVIRIGWLGGAVQARCQASSRTAAIEKNIVAFTNPGNNHGGRLDVLKT
jgi:hypothetical protein